MTGGDRMKKQESVKIQAVVRAPVESVWKYTTLPEHVTRWNFVSDDWHNPGAENDLRPGGKFLYRTEAKNGRSGFDFTGTYDTVSLHERIEYTMDDGRKVRVTFTAK